MSGKGEKIFGTISEVRTSMENLFPKKLQHLFAFTLTVLILTSVIFSCGDQTLERTKLKRQSDSLDMRMKQMQDSIQYFQSHGAINVVIGPDDITQIEP